MHLSEYTGSLPKSTFNRLVDGLFLVYDPSKQSFMSYISLLAGILLMTGIICSHGLAIKNKPRVQAHELVIPETPAPIKKEKDPVLTGFSLPGSFFFLRN